MTIWFLLCLILWALQTISLAIFVVTPPRKVGGVKQPNVTLFVTSLLLGFAAMTAGIIGLVTE
jgi:uncharacterized membrane protein YwzB